jgi:hypothetical protein
MLFNFSKASKPSTKEENAEKQVLASITFVMEDNSEAPAVDVEIKDYSDQSIKALCVLIDTLAQEKSLLQTVEIIKNAMVEDENEESLVKMFSHISHYTKNKMINSYKDQQIDEPCIKPSEVFTK